MIHTGTLLRAELYDDHVSPYTDVQAVYEANKGKHPGKLIVTNAHWYTVSPKLAPCGNYKVNGTVLSKEDWMDWGFGWNAGSMPVMVSTMGNDNYLSTLPVLVDGTRRDDVIDRQATSVRRSTLRTWFGVDKTGKWTIEVTTTNYTLDRIVDRMQALGIVDGMVLDGSGSSQCYDGTTYQRGDGRTIYSYLLLWFAEDGGGKEDDNTATYKKGIDVSQWQGVIDWAKVKAAGIEFAMIRAGYGQNNIDPQFERNISECNRLGIPCGVYWFSYALNADMARQEALYALEAVKPYVLEYPIVFDFEGDSVDYAARKGVKITKELASSFARAFCDELEKNRYYAMVYTNPSYLNRYFDAEIPKEFDIWLAQWPSKPDLAVKPSQAGGIWQYTSSGSVSGISGRVDLNAGYFNYPEIMRSMKLNGLGGEPEPIEPEETELDRAVKWAIEQGISDGTRLDDPAKRSEVILMLYRENGGK